MKGLFVLLLFTLLLGAGCVFTVEHEMKRGLEVEPVEDVVELDATDAEEFDSEVSEGDGSGDVDDGDSGPVRPELTLEVALFYGDEPLEDGEQILISDEEDERADLRYEMSCEPGDECKLECRFSAEAQWEECSPSGEYQIEEEGLYSFEARALWQDEGEGEAAHFKQEVVVLFDFDVSVQGLVTTTGVAHRGVGAAVVECSREDCELSCRWEKDDDVQNFTCPTDPAQSEELEIPAAFATPDASIGLVVEGCATSLNDITDHCRQFIHSFRITDPVWTQVSAGDGFACGILNDDSLWCWGRNSLGQLGVNSQSAQETAPTHVKGRYKKVAAADEHACAISKEGRLYCWGDPGLGRLGLGSSADVMRAPTQVDQKIWKDVATGKESTCAIDDRDDLYCWGANGRGQLGLGDRIERRAPEKVEHPGEQERGWAQVVVGDEHTCGIDLEGGLYCWGSNGGKRLGGLIEEGYAESPQPVVGAFQGDQVARAVSLGVDFSCALRADKKLFCWGRTDRGRLGHDESDIYPFTVVHTELVALESKAAQSCGISEDDLLFCWGENSLGQLGLGEPTGDRYEAFPRSEGESFVAVSLGREFSCGIRSTGRLFCWGSGSYGALGIGDVTSSSVPVPVLWP